LTRLPRCRSRARRSLAAVLVLAFLGAATPAYADFPSGSRILGFGALGLLAPSEAGALIRDERGDFVFGWSWQIPLTIFVLLLREESIRMGEPPPRWLMNHRFIGGVEVLPTASDGHVRGRLGYRFGTHHFVAGFGGTLAARGNTWSPELGVRFLHSTRRVKDDAWDPCMHILVRPEIAPAFDGLRGVTVLLGWTFI
jgi:hypothetical protein